MVDLYQATARVSAGPSHVLHLEVLVLQPHAPEGTPSEVGKPVPVHFSFATLYYYVRLRPCGDYRPSSAAHHQTHLH